MRFVVDASVVLAWHFVEEGWETAEEIGRRALRDGVLVPSHFHLEVANALLRGERERRTTRRDIEAFVERLGLLPLEVDARPGEDVFRRLLPLARDFGLKPYDAGYLHLAMSREVELATFDQALARAARQAGVPIMESDT